MKIKCYIRACAIIALNLIMFISTSNGNELNLNKEIFCIYTLDYTSIYSDAELSIALPIENNECFIIKDKNDDVYKVIIDGNKSGFITKGRIQHLIDYKFGKFISNEEYMKRAKQLTVDKGLESKKKSKLAQKFKKIGIFKGKQLWVKHKVDVLVPFQKVVFDDADFTSENTIQIQLQSGEDLIVIDTLCTDKELAKKINSMFYRSSPYDKWSSKVNKHIGEGKVFIGMTSEQVVASWGEPEDINRTVGRWGVHEQWVYGKAKTYLYFENGKLSSFQD